MLPLLAKEKMEDIESSEARLLPNLAMRTFVVELVNCIKAAMYVARIER